ncbi:hypothetical protein [Streptomyces sp. NPDC006012]|uniref:hypothetical protein n=1 Tax=Streptomyces sp. NPDC006012 TaxID=3364739 RepID=UPI00369BB143
MSFTTITCVIAVCDLCKRRSTDSEYGRHYESADDATADLTADYGTGTAWTLTGDGRLICDRRDQMHDDQRIPVRGWHPGTNAMSITFTPGTPPHTAHP